MFEGLGLLSVALGAVTASGARRIPAYVEMLETGAGWLLIAGFALTALALPRVV